MDFNKNKTLRRMAALCAVFLIVFQAAAPYALAKGRGAIRDAEIEALMRDYARPIFKAARLNPSNMKVIIVDNTAINAFVTSHNRMFLFTGLLLEADTPNEVIGVIAHETGHIIGGHLAQLRQQMRRASATAIITMLLGIAAAAGGAAAGNKHAGSAGTAIATSSSHFARRNLLSYRRIQESSADQAALGFLRETRQSPKGMRDMFDKLANQMLVSLKYVDPYALSHPAPRERMALLERRSKASPYYGKKDPSSLQLRHDLMKAKLYGFTRGQGTVMRKYPKKDKSLAARYARAISVWRNSGIKSAMGQINSLIAAQPRNPWFHEVKGQALLESGRAGEAIPSLKRAVSLAPRAGLVRIMLGQAMLVSGKRQLVKPAIGELIKALRTEANNPNGYRLLAQAYEQTGRRGLAALNSAERFLREGNLTLAIRQATNATKKLRKGSPSHIRASDIIRLKPPAKR